MARGMRTVLAMLLLFGCATDWSQPLEWHGPTGEIRKEVIRETMRQHIGRIRPCHQVDSGPDQHFHADFIIAADGRVPTARVRGPRDTRETERCIVAALREIRFPPPRTGYVLVHYPFVFGAAEDAPTWREVLLAHREVLRECVGPGDVPVGPIKGHVRVEHGRVADISIWHPHARFARCAERLLMGRPTSAGGSFSGSLGL